MIPDTEPGDLALGLDLRSAPRYPTGLAVLDGRYRARTVEVVRTDEDILSAIERFDPTIVAIDAPLALPEGRCCVDEACACAAAGIMRQVDRLCAAAGYRPFPTLLPSMVHLTLRGIALRERLAAAGRAVIEVYPGMTQDILGIPRKRQGVPALRRGLYRAGVRGMPRGRRLSHDELDAVTCALVGVMHLAGETRTMGPGVPAPLVYPASRRARGFETTRVQSGRAEPSICRPAAGARNADAAGHRAARTPDRRRRGRGVAGDEAALAGGGG